MRRWADPASETAHSAGPATSFLTKASPGCVILNALFRLKKGRHSLGPTLAGTCLGHSVQMQAVPGQPRMAGQAPACMGYAPGRAAEAASWSPAPHPPCGPWASRRPPGTCDSVFPQCPDDTQVPDVYFGLSTGVSITRLPDFSVKEKTPRVKVHLKVMLGLLTLPFSALTINTLLQKRKHRNTLRPRE